MIEMLTALAQEPWCFHPSQIAELTDWQVMELYIKPAVKRADELKKSMEKNQSSALPFSPPESSSSPGTRRGLPDRERSIEIMVSFGISAEKAAADWDAANAKQGG